MCAFCFAAQPATAQQVDSSVNRSPLEGLLQLDDPLHRFLQRQFAMGRLPKAHLDHRPLSAYEARGYLDSLALREAQLNPLDRALLARFRGAATAPNAVWINRRVNWLYRNGRNLFSVTGPDYALQVDPLLYLSIGRARQSARQGDEPVITTWQNTRGARAAGHIDIGPLLFFETRLQENQRRVVDPQYANGTAPRLGNSRFIAEDGVHDYFLAMGMVGLHSEHFEIRFGRDRNHWGYGQSSLILSDYATTYDQLQLRTDVWRLQYVNLFTAFTIPESEFEALPRRYGAFHRLSIRLPGRVRLGLFETVVFAPDSADGRPEGYDLTYLNPIIFYRAVERDRGSPDNVLLGIDASWIPHPGVQLYGELILDELVVSELGDATWRNKWGVMAGAYATGLLPGLSARLEYARLRPYLYTHRSVNTAYLHYGDLLGHPAGPNAEDYSLFVRYRPHPRWFGALNLAYTRTGRAPSPDVNIGADPHKPYTTRRSDTGVTLIQGIRQNRLLLEVWAGYQILPTVSLNIALRYEALDDAETGLDRYAQPFVILKWGLPFKSVRW